MTFWFRDRGHKKKPQAGKSWKLNLTKKARQTAIKQSYLINFCSLFKGSALK